MDFSKTFTITLTDINKSFVVHRDPFMRESVYFNKALSSGFAERQEQQVLIKEIDDEQSMDLIVKWTYARHVTDGGGISYGESDTDILTRRVKLYLLADRFMMYNLKNDIVDTYFNRPISRPNFAHAARLLFACGPSVSNLKTLFIEHLSKVVRRYPSTIFPIKNGDARLPETWAADVTKLLDENHELTMSVLGMVAHAASKKGSQRDYHEHPEGFVACKLNTKKRKAPSQAGADPEDPIIIQGPG